MKQVPALGNSSSLYYSSSPFTDFFLYSLPSHFVCYLLAPQILDTDQLGQSFIRSHGLHSHCILMSL
jgi:hypothetical protein